MSEKKFWAYQLLPPWSWTANCLPWVLRDQGLRKVCPLWLSWTKSNRPSNHKGLTTKLSWSLLVLRSVGMDDMAVVIMATDLGWVLESVHTVLTQPGTPVSFWGMCICLLFDFWKLRNSDVSDFRKLRTPTFSDIFVLCNHSHFMPSPFTGDSVRSS